MDTERRKRSEGQAGRGEERQAETTRGERRTTDTDSSLLLTLGRARRWRGALRRGCRSAEALRSEERRPPRRSGRAVGPGRRTSATRERRARNPPPPMRCKSTSLIRSGEPDSPSLSLTKTSVSPSRQCFWSLSPQSRWQVRTFWLILGWILWSQLRLIV